MNSYQLYTKKDSESVVIMDINSPTYIEQQTKIYDEGFEKSGDVIKAKSLEKALKSTKKTNYLTFVYFFILLAIFIYNRYGS